MDLLRQAAQTIIVPAAVAREILARGPRDMTANAVASSTWMKQADDIPIPPNVLVWDLGDGESSVLAWALSHPGTPAIRSQLSTSICREPPHVQANPGDTQPSLLSQATKKPGAAQPPATPPNTPRR